MTNKPILPLWKDEELCVINQGWSGITTWRTGQLVWGRREDEQTWAVRPSDSIGPGCVCVPDDRITPVLRLPALSVNPEWAWLIMNAGKDIENRTRRTHHRGPFLIHASLGSSRHHYNNARTLSADCTDMTIPPFEDLPKGGIVGIAEIADCVTAQNNSSRWFLGPYGYVLTNVRPLPFYRCPGKLGFFYLNSQPK